MNGCLEKLATLILQIQKTIGSSQFLKEDKIDGVIVIRITSLLRFSAQLD
jgi:hypothetical protein